MTVISWIIIVEEGGHGKVLDDHDYRCRRMMSAATYDKARTDGCPGLDRWAYISGLSQVGRRMDRSSSVLRSSAPGTFVGAQRNELDTEKLRVLSWVLLMCCSIMRSPF